jgi:ubiquinone/menaquinone biosynthesis C-methylase UbiE
MMKDWKTLLWGTGLFGILAQISVVVGADSPVPKSPYPGEPAASRSQLPDHYPFVAADLLAYCRPQPGIWVDLGSGSGGVALALAVAEDTKGSKSTLVLVDPNADALSEGLRSARAKGLGNRVVAVIGTAEKIPLPSDSADLVVSRGSIFFWRDPVKGVQEVYRVLRPGGKAMIGGGVGSKYSEWARQEFARRRQGSMKPDSEEAKRFAKLRSPETFRRWAKDAGLADFQVSGEGAVRADDPHAGLGVWLRFAKQESK